MADFQARGVRMRLTGLAGSSAPEMPITTGDPVTPEQVELVEQSWARAEPALDGVVADFYDRLFAAAPGVRSLFPDDMADQQRKLGAMLVMIVSDIRDHDAFVEMLSGLGRRHVAYGAQVGHYAVVGAALLGALGAGLGDSWDAATAQAWSAAYGLVSEVMMDAAAEKSAGPAD